MRTVTVRRLGARFGPESAVFALALGVRLLPAILHGSLTGNYGYDASVYYSAADAFVHGRMPYRDFVLVHPPGVMLADSPFAVLGSLTSDTIGFAADNAGFAVIGAISAVLVCWVGRRLNLPRRATLGGGVVYALWFGSIGAEYEARLEPLGCALMLSGLLALLKAQTATRPRPQRLLAMLSGAAFGAATSVKIWWAVPVLVILAWQLVIERAPRRALRVLLGAIIAGALIDLPFFVAARGAMWRMVVLDQLGRPRSDPGGLIRAGYLAIGAPRDTLSRTSLWVAVLTVAAAVVVMALRAWRVKPARLIVVLLAVQLGEVMISPSFFGFYADFLTVPLALIAAASVAPSPKRQEVRDDRAGWWAAAAAVAMGVGLYYALPLDNRIADFPGTTLAREAASYRCVISDSPMSLIDANLLSRDYHNGCPNLVDVNGLDLELLRGLQPDRYREALPRWNADLLEYFRSGDAVVLMRTPRSLSMSPAVTKAVERDGLVADDGGYKLYRVVGSLSPPAA